MSDSRPPLPPFAENIRRKYLRGESSVFILHLNVYDRILYDGEFYTLVEFLTKVLLWENKQNIFVFDPSSGGHVLKVDKSRAALYDLMEIGTKKKLDEVLPLFEKALLSTDSTAILMPYAGTLLPPGEMNFLGTQDRINVITFHRWSLNQGLIDKDNVIFLISEGLGDIHPLLVSNPKIAAIEIPLPEFEQRKAVIRKTDPDISEENAVRLAEHTAGLKAVQLQTMLTPDQDQGLDHQERKAFVKTLLGKTKDAEERAERMAALTHGMSRDEIRHLIDPDAPTPDAPKHDPYAEVLKLIHNRKREIIEKECHGLIEFVDARHDFSVVGGNEEIKNELLHVAKNIKAGNRDRVPMGLLFVGPMGTGKTFVAGAFAREAQITAIKLKNFRSKWVGETESNLEKVLSIIKAMGPIMLIIDEGDRSFGSGSGSDGDGGTSSRIIARLKEFMSDTENRGQVLFVLMTNRPDKLDVDIKRAGRLDRKIPFFYGETEKDIESVLGALLRRYKIDHSLKWSKDRENTSARLLGYSNADLEAIVLLANDIAHQKNGKVTSAVFAEAVNDYLPSRDSRMLEYMELLAVFEASNKRFLPVKYKDLTADELNERLRALKSILRI